MDIQTDGSWHLDKKVPIALAIMIAVQTVALIYVGTSWKSDIDHRLSTLEKSDGLRSPQESRIVILEEQFKFIQMTLNRIENKIDEVKPK